MKNHCLMLTIQEFLENEAHEYVISDSNDENDKKIIKLPKDRTYSIPAYQREIRWGAENVNILINDIFVSEKFLGTILLNRVDDSHYEIIDGQQRISVLILILNAISKLNSSELNLCKFINETYACLFDVLELDFNITKINSDRNAEKYFNSDILDQRDRFEIIWNTIRDKIQNMDPENLTQFQDKLLFSEINIIFADNKNSKTFVDYYLDLNDKSVRLDNIDILKANLFRENYKLMSAEWANVQKAIKELRIAGLGNYSLPTFYYHYFVCTVNEYLDYKLSTLKIDLKFDKRMNIKGHTYEAGTNILKAINSQKYFKDTIKQLKEVTIFLKCIYKNDGLATLKEKLKTCCSDDTISCIISIVSAVIRIDDEVPKILIMKYFLDILNKESINKNEVKIIFYIYVYSILFTLTGGKKESSKLVRIVLSSDWIDKLKNATIKLWNDSKGNINYFKKITINGKVTEESGKYLPKHIMAIKEFANINSSISFNQKKLKEFLTSSTCTAEHFFINKSKKVIFRFGSKEIETEIALPKCITKYISCPVNYLYINSDVNGDMGNKSIKDKIKLLEEKGRAAFSSDWSYKYFEKAKEAFDADGAYPDLTSYTNKSKAQAALRKYYKENLYKIMESYIELIKSL